MSEEMTYTKGHKAYAPTVKTDVMATFIRHGFEPPSSQKAYQEKWHYYQHLHELEPINPQSAKDATR